MSSAKVFWSGRSQAIRLPKAFRFNTKTVHIRRHGNAIILESVAEDWAWLDAVSGKLDKDFISAASKKTQQQERPKLDELFE